eukprot:Sdes_comp17562_c0_seq1m6803
MIFLPFLKPEKHWPKLLGATVAVNLSVHLLVQENLVPTPMIGLPDAAAISMVLVQPKDIFEFFPDCCGSQDGPQNSKEESSKDAEGKNASIHHIPFSIKGRVISYYLREGQQNISHFKNLDDNTQQSFKDNLGEIRSNELHNETMGHHHPYKIFSTEEAVAYRERPMNCCPNLLLHFHGGGFISQSSQAHESYLKKWASDMGFVILSIDYSLAPEFPFPWAVNECFYAYTWVLANHLDIGWTGQRICVVGDSAGGNLAFSITLKAIEKGIRIPDYLFGIYPSLLVGDSPSPSRLLGTMDPILSVGILKKVLHAYSGTLPSNNDNYFLSPLLAPANMLLRFPKVYIVAAELDPLLDDSVDFVRRMISLGKSVEFVVASDVPHGFLNFAEGGDAVKNGLKLCSSYLYSMFSSI